MATQANITLTALPQGDDPLPGLDIPIRKMTLSYPNDFVILGRASIKEPRPRTDGRVDKKTVSRIAAVDNGYMSRNETVGSEHAALILRHDGEVCIEHKAGRFPPTFLNGNQVIDPVQVENNDIINLGPLNPYTSKHKNRTYQPFALKVNIAYKYKVLTGDETSSSSEEEDCLINGDDEMGEASLSMGATPSPPKSSPPNTIHQHEVIDVSSSDDSDSSTHDDDDIYGATPRPQSSQQSEKKTETVIIDLTENEERSDMQAISQQPRSTHVSHAQYDSSSDEDETDEDVNLEKESMTYMTTAIDEELDSDELDDSIFGDDASSAPSEEPIERSPPSGPFSRGFRLDYSPEPELFTSDMDIGLGSDFDSEDTDIEEEDLDMSEPVVPEQPTPKVHPYLVDHLRRFQEDERARLEKKEREEEQDRREELAALYKRAEERERDEGIVQELKEKADRWEAGMEKERADREEAHREKVQRDNAIAAVRRMQQWDKQCQNVEPQADAMRPTSQTETSNNLAIPEVIEKDVVSAQPALALDVPEPMASRAIGVYSFFRPQPVTPPLQVLSHQAAQLANNTPDTAHFRDVDLGMDTQDMKAQVNLARAQYSRISEAMASSTEYETRTFAPRLKSRELAPSHSASDFQAARAENRAAVQSQMSQTQQPTPPSLLMSGSLFGQSLEAGMQLPALPPLKPKDNTPGYVIEDTKKYFDAQTGMWKGQHRVRGKVTIEDLLEQEEQVYRDNYEEEEEEAEDEEMEMEFERAIAEAKESMNGWMFEKPDGTTAPFCNAADKAAPLPTPSTEPECPTEITNKVKLSPPQQLTAEDPRLSKRLPLPIPDAIAKPFQAVYNTQVNIDRILAHESSKVLEAISQAKTTDKEAAGSSTSTPSPTENKKRKHVEFEDHDTVIAPTAALVKHVHFDQPIAISIATRPFGDRPIATPVRPSRKLKGLKKVAEGLGLVALGAAGVFAALVASAPEF